MIGGTRTGGSVCIDYFARFKADKKRRLIAIMLGRLRMTVDECIDAYISLSDRIFPEAETPCDDQRPGPRTI